MNDTTEVAPGQQRIAELEDRVKWLEGALTSILQERRRSRARRVQAEDIFGDDEDALAEPEQTPDRTQPMYLLEARARAEAARTERDAMRFTSAFSTLDERLREQIEAEAAPGPQIDLTPPVLLDPELIDRAFARPQPQKLDVRCALEESYPHLMERVVTLWGEPEVEDFLRKLIVDDRGSRQGFPFEVMSELLVLSALAQRPRGGAVRG